MGPATEEFIREWMPRLSDDGKERVAKLLLEYGIGHRDLTDEETAEAAKMLVKIVRETRTR